LSSSLFDTFNLHKVPFTFSLSVHFKITSIGRLYFYSGVAQQTLNEVQSIEKAITDAKTIKNETTKLQQETDVKLNQINNITQSVRLCSIAFHSTTTHTRTVFVSRVFANDSNYRQISICKYFQ